MIRLSILGALGRSWGLAPAPIPGSSPGPHPACPKLPLSKVKSVELTTSVLSKSALASYPIWPTDLPNVTFNVVNSTDFTTLKSTFGKSYGQIGYDARADFDNNDVVNSTDFTLLKGNFGQSGCGPNL